MRRDKRVSLILFLIGLLICIGISIWIGFPCEGFDRFAIVITGYFIGVWFVIKGGSNLFYD